MILKRQMTPAELKALELDFSEGLDNESMGGVDFIQSATASILDGGGNPKAVSWCKAQELNSGGVNSSGKAQVSPGD